MLFSIKDRIKHHFAEVIRLKTSGHAIALGFAVGSFISILPTPGFSAFIAEQSTEETRARVFGITEAIDHRPRKIFSELRDRHVRLRAQHHAGHERGHCQKSLHDQHSLLPTGSSMP